jgi:2'-5' RNA ligase
MNNKSYKSAVVVIPPKATWHPIQALRKRYDRGFRRWMPHITLLYPFRPRTEFQAAVAPLAEVGARLAPFEVTLTGFDFFRHGGQSHTLWLRPEPLEALVGLQTALWKVFPDCDEVRRFESGFVPHLSVGQVKGGEQVAQLLAGWERDWRPIRFPVSALSLIWRGEPPDDVFRVGQTIELRGNT